MTALCTGGGGWLAPSPGGAHVTFRKLKTSRKFSPDNFGRPELLDNITKQNLHKMHIRNSVDKTPAQLHMHTADNFLRNKRFQGEGGGTWAFRRGLASRMAG